MEKTSYLEDGRLADVLALIQILAYGFNTSRSDEGLLRDFKNKPVSAAKWTDIGLDHPEFFRVRDRKGKSESKRVSLVARFILPYEAVDGDEEDEEKRPKLDPVIVNKLMELAVDIHDRQVSQSEKWKVVIPMIVAIIGATASIVAAILSSNT